MKHLLRNSIILLFVLIRFNGFTQTVDSNYLDGEIYVKYKDDFPVNFSQEFVEPHTLQGLNPEILAQFGIIDARFSFNKVQYIKLQKTVRLKFTAIKAVDKLIEYFTSQPFIEYAEKIPAYRPTYTPNDLGVNSVGEQWYLYTIKAREAWSYSKGDSNIVVAVVDQEFNINHDDLKNNIWKNPGEIPNNGIDDDGNGYIDDVSGWDMSDNDNNVITTNTTYLDHGTPCAGLVSATTDNNSGISSIGFFVKVLPVKTSQDAQTHKSLRNATEGIVYAALMGADVISCSFGSNAYSLTTENAVNYAFSKNCMIVASAGNDNNTLTHYPSSYTGVISVAASDISDKKASFSNYGTRVNVCAPGVGMLTTKTDGSYYSFGGTSAACPLTAGLLGLMKSYRPLLSTYSLKECLLKSTDNIDAKNSGYIGLLGSGRINADRAMRCVDSTSKAPPKMIIQTSESATCPNKKIKITASAVNKNVDSVVWYLPGAITLSQIGLDIEVKYPANGVYSVAVIGYNSYGHDSIYIQDYVSINTGYISALYYENFEDSASFNNHTIINPDNKITWIQAIAPTTENKGNKAMKMDFFNYTTSGVGVRDAFILPPIDLSRSLKPQLTFSHAYSDYYSQSEDSLIVYASLDSGKTFPYKVLAVHCQSMITRSTGISFTPQNNSEWCFGSGVSCHSVIMDSVFAGKNHVVVKFEAYHKVGNNLYIDNIKIFSKCSDVLFVPPSSDFSTSKTEVCEGNKIQFNNKSLLATNGYQWIFEGGVPDTSTLENPKVEYPVSGVYDVTLVAANPLGYDTLILKDYINCIAPPKIIVDDTQKYVCPGDSIHFTATGADSIIWYKHNTKTNVYGSVLGDKPVQTTIYSVKGYNSFGCWDSIGVRGVYVPLPPPVFISVSGKTITAVHNPGLFSYSWFLNDSDINLHASTIEPKKTGNYKVVITDSAGCNSVSQQVYFEYLPSTKGIIGVNSDKINIYPNPTTGDVYFEGLAKGVEAKIMLTDMIGRKVLETITVSSSINVDILPAGLYFISVEQNNTVVSQKLRVE